MITPIVSEEEWMVWLADVPRGAIPRMNALVLVPHPDDETLSVGGALSSLRSLGHDVTILAVTDGENAYGGSVRLGKERELEQTVALKHLGIEAKSIHRLRLQDSNVAANEDDLAEALARLMRKDTHILAPWKCDFHPDHEASGRVAERFADSENALLTYYFFWAWHRGTMDLFDQASLSILPLDELHLRAKRSALACHRSQLYHESGAPILPENLLAPARRSFEVFLPHRRS
jgi:LmbE family N-acetylglucosaminyl deacetylase